MVNSMRKNRNPEKISRPKQNKTEIVTQKKAKKDVMSPDGYPIRVGILRNNLMNGLLQPDVPGAFEDVFIDRSNLNGAPFDMKVVCEVFETPEDYEERGRQYYFNSLTGNGMAKGRIIEVLGESGLNDSTISGILISHGISSDFPNEVKMAASVLPDEITDEEINRELQNGRIDRRNEKIITIDGEDAKDLDDAISITKTSSNHYILGVHIADVTHYVKEGDPIDEEAITRGTSVYLVDRVVPMLPQALSNGLCSLHPGKPKFALSVISEWDESGVLVNTKITQSVITSSERFTYDEVYRMLGPEKKKIKRLEGFREMLTNVLELTEKLRKIRFERGAINFEFPETKVKLDLDKAAIDVYPAKTSFANEMIEECMIACNEIVAQKFALLKAPFIYRVHEQPDTEKLERFIKVSHLFGIKIRFSQLTKSQEIHNAIKEIENTPYGNTLMQLLLRSMAKARYSEKCLGHFGLASTFYCHFTSPIRRYPDLFIHRVVKAFINKQKFPKKWEISSRVASEMNSNSEREAMQAERESVDYKTAEYMEKHIGDTFEGKVTGMFNSGIFVQLENTIEGMAPFRTMGAYYEYDEEQMVARSDVGNRVIRIGDLVTIKVFKSDKIARRIEFSLDETTLKQENNSPRNRKSKQNTKFGSKSGKTTVNNFQSPGNKKQSKKKDKGRKNKGKPNGK